MGDGEREFQILTPEMAWLLVVQLGPCCKIHSLLYYGKLAMNSIFSEHAKLKHAAVQQLLCKQPNKALQ